MSLVITTTTRVWSITRPSLVYKLSWINLVPITQRAPGLRHGFLASPSLRTRVILQKPLTLFKICYSIASLWSHLDLLWVTLDAVPATLLQRALSSRRFRSWISNRKSVILLNKWISLGNSHWNFVLTDIIILYFGCFFGHLLWIENILVNSVQTGVLHLPSNSSAIFNRLILIPQVNIHMIWIICLILTIFQYFWLI